MAELVGVVREAQFSPGRVQDDASILTQTATALRAYGLEVDIWAADRLEAADDLPPACRGVLAMCQSSGALRALDRFATRVPVINSPSAIRHCYRHETVALLDGAGVPFPRTTMVATHAAPPTGVAPCWVKRGDVHAMAADDVVFATTDAATAEAVAAFAMRGIGTVVLQAHVEGAVLKFYGIADGSFFRCYAGGDEAPADLDSLWSVAHAGAAALGLEVFGGDVVVPPAGSPVVIDVNDWPSFARCRDDAADAIARYVAERVRPEGRTEGTAGSRAIERSNHP